VVELNGKSGCIDRSGKEVIPLKYDLVGDFSEGLAIVMLDGRYGFIDKSGKEVVTPLYDFVDDNFSDGLAKVMLNGKYGFIDKSGNVVIPLKYDEVWSFSEELAAVRVNNKYGYIDKSGKEIISLKYDMANDFSGGLAKVKLNGRELWIDKNGKDAISLKQKEITNDNTGHLSKGFLKKTTSQISSSTKNNDTRSYKYSTTFDNPFMEIPLRSEPNVNSAEIYKCPKNAIVYVIDDSGDVYYKACVDGHTGYLSKGFLKKTTPKTPSPTKNKDKDAYKYSTTFDNPMIDVPLRIEPNANSVEIYKCPKNAIVYVIDDSGDVYYKAYVDGHTGYLSKGFLKRQK
jgi:hypothetical protein